MDNPMDDCLKTFQERKNEIVAYLDFLEAIDKQIQGPRKNVGITILQQRILYSSVYLLLYNLVESTITRAVNAISLAIIDKQLKVSDLSEALRSQWVRATARTHSELNYEKRLQYALELYNHLVEEKPITKFEIEKGGGGSWDEEQIFKFCKRLQLDLNISHESEHAVKEPYKEGQKRLEFIKFRRNQLAHGQISFAECGENITVSELRDLTYKVSSYMDDIITSFKSFLDTNQFLLKKITPEKRESRGRRK